MYETIVGRTKEDLKEFGSKATGYIGKHIVGKGEDAHLTTKVFLDLLRPHIILICGKRGFGKCLKASDIIITSDGSILTVETLFDSLVDNPGNKEIFRGVRNRNINVLSLSSDLKLRFKKITHCYRKKIKEKIIKIKTRTGREISATKEHPLMVIEEGIKWKGASDITPEDYIALPRKIKVEDKEVLLPSPNGFKSVKYFSRDSRKIKILDLIHRQQQVPLKDILKRFRYSGSTYSLLRSLRKQQLIQISPNPDVVTLTEQGRFYLESLIVKGYYARYLNGYPIKIPKVVDTRLAEFFAYLIAEGIETGKARFIFTNLDKFRQNKFSEWVSQLFGIIPTIGDEDVYLNSVNLRYLLECWNYKFGKHSSEKEIPEFILKASDKIISKFLMAFSDCEAYISKKDPVIEITTASKKLAERLTYLFLRFGIFSILKEREKYATNTRAKTRRKYYTLYICGKNNLEKFYKKIRFEDPRKLARLKHHIRREIKPNPNLDVVPKIGKLLWQTRRLLGLRRKDITTKQVVKAYEDEKYYPSRKFLNKFLNKFRLKLRQIERAYSRFKREESLQTAVKLIKLLRLQWKNISLMYESSRTGIDVLNCKKLKQNPSLLFKFIDKSSIYPINLARQNIHLLEKLSVSDIFWDKVKEIKKSDYDGYVYDFTIDKTHNFVAGSGGVICHNSYDAGTIAEEIALLPQEFRNSLAVVMVDTMGIFWSLKKPNEQQSELLSEWDLKPKGVGNVKVFVPFKQKEEFEKAGIPIDGGISIMPHEFSAEDWRLAFNLSPTDKVGIALEKNVNELIETREKFTIEDLITKIRDDMETSGEVKNALENMLTVANQWGVFGTEGIDIYDIVQPGTISIVDVSHLRATEAWSVRNFLVAILARRIYQERIIARKEEEIAKMTGEKVEKEFPMVWLIIDEAHHFVGTEPSVSSGPLLTIAKQGREPGISLVVITQMPNKIHQDVLSQCDLVFSHRLTSKADLEALHTIAQTYMAEDIWKYINRLPRGWYGACIILDDNLEKIFSVQIRPRTSHHAGGTAALVK